MSVTEAEVILAYRLLLDRTPSSQEVAHMQKGVSDVAGLRNTIFGSAEFLRLVGAQNAKHLTKPSPRDALYHYYCEFDALGTIAAHAQSNLMPSPGVSTNFLGLKVPTKVHPPVLAGLAGRVEALPDPGNWHADIAEWAAALHSIDKAQDTYRIVELGCGWGCWISNMGLAARNRGLKVDLVGVEGDAIHLKNAAEVLKLNGFEEGQYRLLHGIAAPRSGKAIFPLAAEGVTDWNREAVFYPDAKTLAAAQKDVGMQVLDCLTLEELGQGKPIDLLHIDIQGAETDFVRGNHSDMDRLVRRVLIGTHSRVIEGELMDHFLKSGWRLEMDRPVIAPLHNGKPITGIDGVQLWANQKDICK